MSWSGRRRNTYGDAMLGIEVRNRKVGFTDEGRLREVLRRDGQWYDMFTMGLLEGELR